MISSSQLNQNIFSLQEKIHAATKQASRQTDEIKIVAVTKTFPEQIWNLALEHNLSTIGESKIQETEIKLNKLFYRYRF